MTYLWGHELSNPPRCWKRVNGCVDVGAAKWSSCLPCLIIRLIIQTIRPDRSGSVWTDGTPNVSRPDPSGAIPTDAKHPTRNRKMEGSNPLSAPRIARPASSSSALSCWVEVLELDAGVFGGEPPVDPATGPVARRLPSRDLPLQGRPVGQATVQALSGQHGQLDLGHVQPAAVLWGGVQL